MTNTDENSTSWVDGMYQKFEAVFTDAEETTYEDPVKYVEDQVKYVEDQVKTVGACVKKFYSDVFLDFLSESPDGPGIPSLHLVHYSDSGIFETSHVNTRRKPVNVESEEPSRDSDLSLQLNESTDERLSSGSCNLNNQSEIDQSEEKGQGKTHDEVDEDNRCVTNNSVISSSSEATTCGEPMNDEILSKIPDGSSSDEPVESDDVETEALQFNEQFRSLKLDESCVLVDKYEYYPVSHLEAKQRSHKKKIGDVFYLRRWSKGKIQKQLEALQEEMDSEKSTNPQSNSLESGWEMV